MVQEIEEPDDFESLRAKMATEKNDKGINPARWDRIRNGAVLFSDIVEELTGHRGSMISCPFHGADRTPSFAIYPPALGNCGYCFGCSKMYDAFRFVAEYNGISVYKALLWIEQTYDLPPLGDEELEEEDEEIVQIEFDDLVEPFIAHARNDIQTQKDVDLAEEYLRIYFSADREKAALPLARVLGREELKRISSKKGRSHA